MSTPVPDVTGLLLLTTIAETGSLGAAARRLGMAQPNASRRLVRLEADLRLRLVDRSPRGSHLTPAGQLVAEWAAPVLTSLDRLAAGAAALRDDVASHLTVGASLTVGEHLVPRWLTSFRASHPDVHVTVRVMNSAEVVAAVADARIDVGFVETPDAPAHLSSMVVARDRLVLVVGPRHPWARRSSAVGADELAATPLVVRERGSGTRSTLDRLLAGRDTAEPLMELSSTGAIVASVAAGMGAAVVSALAVEAACKAGLVRQVVLAPELHRDLRAVWPAARRLTGPAGDFVHHAARHHPDPA